MRRLAWLALVTLLGCSAGTGGGGSGEGGASASTTEVGSGSGSGGGAVTVGSGGGSQLGCNAVDVLFVIDDSASMGLYQKGLAQAFPSFADAIDGALPAGIDLHVAITTSSFCDGSSSHSENNCVAAESPTDIEDHLVQPTDQTLPENGYQGRFFEWDGKKFFAATTGDPTTMGGLKSWFGGAAPAVGSSGCSFDYTVAASGWAADPVNAPSNAGFFRDAGAVLVLFVLTDEADHSTPTNETLAMYHDMLASQKATCGGDTCIITGGLLNANCVPSHQTNIWDFLNLFGEPPVWGDIAGGSQNPLSDPPKPEEYTKVIAAALAPVVKQTCDSIPVPK